MSDAATPAGKPQHAVVIITPSSTGGGNMVATKGQATTPSRSSSAALVKPPGFFDFLFDKPPEDEVKEEEKPTAARSKKHKQQSAPASAVPKKAELTEKQKTFWKARKLQPFAKRRDVWALGQYFGWNYGAMQYGVGVSMLASALIALAYLTLCLSLAEMSSSMPFAGGAYGFARITQGRFVGYLVGSCETLEYILYVSSSVITIGQMITELTGLPTHYEPLWWTLFFALSLAIHIHGGQAFWSFNFWLAVGTTLIPIIYFFGVIPWIDLEHFKPVNHDTPLAPAFFTGGMAGFLHVLPIATWLFIGVETLSLASEEVFEPKTDIPQGQIACIITLFLTAIATFMTTIGNAPNIYDFNNTLVVFNRGFSQMFAIPRVLATAFALPATFATAHGFMFCYGRQMFALARANLIPGVLSLTTQANHTPYVALLAGTFAAYLITIAGWLHPALAAPIFQICISGAFLSYIIQLTSYILLRKHFANIKRGFTSFVGIYGALFAIIVFALGLIGSLFFQQHRGKIIVFQVLYYTVASLWYILISRHYQIVSPEEQKVLFIAYVIKTNLASEAKMQASKKMRGGIFSFIFGGPKILPGPDDEDLKQRLAERNQMRVKKPMKQVQKVTPPIPISGSGRRNVAFAPEAIEAPLPATAAAGREAPAAPSPAPRRRRSSHHTPSHHALEELVTNFASNIRESILAPDNPEYLSASFRANLQAYEDEDFKSTWGQSSPRESCGSEGVVEQEHNPFDDGEARLEAGGAESPTFGPMTPGVELPEAAAASNTASSP